MTSMPQSPPADPAEPPPWARTFLRRWHQAECWIAVVAFSIITALLLTDVVLREILSPILRFLRIYDGAMGILFAQRLSIYALIVGAFAGVGIATATGSHLVPQAGHALVPASWGPFMDRLADLITGLVLMVTAYYGWVFVASSRATDLRAPVLDWSVWRLQLAIPLGFASAAVRYFMFAAYPALRPMQPETKE
jgi:TRAP-type C4-dicarboxylate transport system permease small subunit